MMSSFQRSFPLPWEPDPEQVAVTYSVACLERRASLQRPRLKTALCWLMWRASLVLQSPWMLGERIHRLRSLQAVEVR